MPRIRTIKPEFFTSETVADLPMRARLTWIGLWTYCDDFGRCRDNVKLIKAAVWALDDVSLSHIEKDLTDLQACGLVYRYEVAGKVYLQITNWSEHQRVSHPTVSKIPPPREGFTGPPPGGGVPPEGSGIFPEDSGASRDSSGNLLNGKEGNREQGREEEKTLALAVAPPRDLFAEFWNVYPRREDKRTAERAWRAALKRATSQGVTADQIIEAASRYAHSKVGVVRKYIKLPTTWLNADAFNNEPEPAVRLVVGWEGPYKNAPESDYDAPLLDPIPAEEFS